MIIDKDDFSVALERVVDKLAYDNYFSVVVFYLNLI